MKVLIAFFICIVAVLGEVREESENDRTGVLLKQSATACVQEMKLDKQPSLDDNACFYACVDQKMGVMNEDGTYVLEHLIPYQLTTEGRQRVKNIFNTKMKECATKVSKNPCQMAACVHSLPQSYYRDLLD